MNANEYQCSVCKGIFEKGWTDEEAKSEYSENFPKSEEAGDEMDVVCDDCYNRMIDIFPPSEYEKTL